MPGTGVTPQGFVAKTVVDLQSDLSSNAQARIDPSIDTSPEEPLGQIFGIVSEKAAELWELGGVAYNGMNRDAAEGPQLDNVNGLTGTKRLPARPSFTLQTNVFSQVGSFAAGALVANVNGQPSIQFANGDQLDITLVSGTYYAKVGSTILATSASLPITVPGMKFFCTQNGPTIANSGTLTVITTPVTGWSSTTNPLDAQLGALIESDTDYRLRGEQEISAVGSGTPDAMRADVRQVPGVIQAFVLENTSNITDGNGVPSHCFMVVIWDGVSPVASNDEVAQAIWDDKPTGIAASGGFGGFDVGNAIDSQGNTQVVPFKRATQDTLYLTYTVTMMPGFAFNSQVAAAIKQAVVSLTQSQYITRPDGTLAPNAAYLGLADEVVAQAMKAAVLQAGLDVLDVTALQLGFTASPVGTANLAVGATEIAVADTSRILVNGI